MAAYQKAHTTVDFSSVVAFIVVAALLGTAALDVYAFGTFFNVFGPGHGSSVVHLDRNTSHEVARVSHTMPGHLPR